MFEVERNGRPLRLRGWRRERQLLSTGRQIPLGTALPNGTRSSCSACTKSVLNVYEDAHNKGGVPSLDSTYDDAVDKTQIACGMTYVQAVNGATVRWTGLGSVWWTALLGTMFVVGILGTS